MGVNITINDVFAFKNFLNFSVEKFLEIERIDFQDIEKYFPKTDEMIEACKNALSQCAALKAMGFASCKLYEFQVDSFRILRDLLLKCPNLMLLDVKNTVSRLLLIHTEDNQKRFETFCEAVGECNNLKIIIFNENVYQKINETCFQHFLVAIKKLKGLYNIQYDIRDFKCAHITAINNVLMKHHHDRKQINQQLTVELKKYESNKTAEGVFFSVDPQKKVASVKNKFLNRFHEKIKIESLYDGKFLLDKSYRDNLMLNIALSREIGSKNESFNSLIHHEKFLYFNHDHQVFVGSYNDYLGRGQSGAAFIVQNALTGKWHCLKILKKGTLRDNNEKDSSELSILAQEGMLVWADKTANEDLIISDLIYGESLSAVIQTHRKNKSLSFEKALALIISLVESYESLHLKNYAHRDIKPDNVIFDREQEKCVAIDFGITKKVGENSAIEGSLKYMAPEAFNCKLPNLKNDIYAMGMVAGEILTSVIGEQNFCDWQMLVKHCEQHSLDTSTTIIVNENGSYNEELMKKRNEQQPLDVPSAIQERYAYLKETCKKIYKQLTAIEGFKRLYLEMLPILFAATSQEYQEKEGLSKQFIAVCCLIYQMTGPIENRSVINTVLAKMRQIRTDHIEDRMHSSPHFLEENYNRLLNALYEKRKNLAHAPYALDNLDIFILRVIDVNEKNRPTIEEVEKYLEKCQNILMLKKNLNYAFKMRCQKSANNTQVQKTKRGRDVEIQEYLSATKENINPKRHQNMALKSILPQELPLSGQQIKQKRSQKHLDTKVRERKNR